MIIRVKILYGINTGLVIQVEETFVTNLDHMIDKKRHYLISENNLYVIIDVIRYPLSFNNIFIRS